MARTLQTSATVTTTAGATGDGRPRECHRKQEFEEVQRRMGPELLAFFSVPRRRIPGVEPEDLAQMTLVRVYRSMETFRHESGVRTWVLKIAVHVWSNALRDRRADKRAAEEVSLDACRDDSHGGQLIELRVPGNDPQQQLLAEERTRLLQEAIGTLPAKMRRCMMLRNRDELSIHEIALVLKVKESTVKSHLQEGNRRLGPLLRERFGISAESPETRVNAP